MVGVRSAAVAGAMILSCLGPAVAHAQRTGLDDLVGARAGQAESEIRRRGYVDIRGEKRGDRSYAFWWSEDRRQCVSIATMDGRYDSIQPTSPPDCRKSDRRAGRDDRRQDYAYDSGPAMPPPRYRDDDRRPDVDAPSVDGRSVELGLVCFGDGTKDGIATGSTWTWSGKHNRYEYGQYSTTRTDVFDASLMIQTWAGGGRIRLPRSLIPPLHSGGQDGWWDLYDVYVSPDEIRAHYRLNGANKPRVTIDRRSGRINVEGFSSYGFRGSCDTIGHTPRRF